MQRLYRGKENVADDRTAEALLCNTCPGLLLAVKELGISVDIQTGPQKGATSFRY